MLPHIPTVKTFFFLLVSLFFTRICMLLMFKYQAGAAFAEQFNLGFTVWYEVVIPMTSEACSSSPDSSDPPCWPARIVSSAPWCSFPALPAQSKLRAPKELHILCLSEGLQQRWGACSMLCTTLSEDKDLFLGNELSRKEDLRWGKWRVLAELRLFSWISSSWWII